MNKDIKSSEVIQAIVDIAQTRNENDLRRKAKKKDKDSRTLTQMRQDNIRMLEYIKLINDHVAFFTIEDLAVCDKEMFTAYFRQLRRMLKRARLYASGCVKR